ncbi:hypothetical protein [Novosphingobium sp.]|uniref:hypothetical protein n=1 Tax=Novosphingobium sp. TaxID=1874826 RepID=UPI003BA844BA
MRDSLLPAAMLCVSLALPLGFATARTAAAAVAASLAGAGLALLLPIPPGHEDVIFSGCWFSTLILTACVHLPRGLARAGALALGANAGLWAGQVVQTDGHASNLLIALPLVLLCVPARWLVQAERGIALKVVASWLMAIAGMEMVLTLIPTPGYMPDHMD